MPSNPKNSKPSSFWIIGIVLIFALLLGTSVFLLADQSKKSEDTSHLTPTRKVSPTPPLATESATLSEDEQQAIDKWIEENNLNEYGDSQDTVYAGGTPLFNETTGETKNRYEYIVENHPDRPWNN